MDQAAEIIDAIVEPKKNHPVEIPKTPKARIYFSWEKSQRIHELPFLIILFLTTLILGVCVYPLGLLQNDHIGILTTATGSLFGSVWNYTYSFGLTQPLGILFNSSMYLIALQSYSLAHIFILSAHIFTGALLAIMVSKKYTRVESALFGILYISLPLFTAQYGWLIQGNVTAALFILSLQLLVVQSNRVDFVVKGVAVMILQLFGILLHESLLFTFIPILIFLLPMEKPYFSGVHLRTILLISVPSFLYLLLKLFALPPHNGTYVWHTYVVEGFQSVFLNLQNLISEPVTFFHFWSSSVGKGLEIMTSSYILIIAFILLCGVILYELSIFFTSTIAKHEVSTPIVNPLFWLILGCCALVPYSATALAFPFFCFLAATFQLIRMLQPRVAVLFASVLMLIYIPSSVYLLNQMQTQSDHDEKYISQIISKIDSRTKPSDRVIVRIENPPVTKMAAPFDSIISSCTTNPTCLEAAFVRRTNRIVSVKTTQSGIETQPIFPFKYDPNTDEFVAE